MMFELKSGSKAFKAATGANSFDIRMMENLGIIAPTKTECGWRQFSKHDEAAGKAWMADRLHSRQRNTKFAGRQRA
jgi:hypothetical protein